MKYPRKHSAVASQLSHSGRSEWLTLSTYPSHGYRYYRLQWGRGDRNLGSRHIPGGNVGKFKADKRAGQIAQWIKESRDRRSLLKQIRAWAKADRAVVTEQPATAHQLSFWQKSGCV